MILEHLPALQVVVPLLAAPICLLLPRRSLVTGFTILVSIATLLISLLLLEQVLQTGTISYHLGGWEPPWGIEYRVDLLNAFVLVLVAGIGAFVAVYSPASVSLEVRYRAYGFFYAMYLLCLAGLLGITITGDMFNVFVFLEISALSSYVLISMGQDRRALTASFQYLIMGTIGGTFFLIGVGLLYVITGTLNMADLAARLPEVTQLRTEHTAFAFIVVGIGLKLAMFPLHLWLPNAYAYAPSAATVFIAATATKVAVYVLLRFIFSIFGEGVAYQDLPFGQIAMVLAIAGMLTASTVAIFQGNIKRMLAYSSVAQIGYIVLGLSLDTVAGVTASLLHLFNHALMKAALFMAVACFFYRAGSMALADLEGIGRRMPWTFAALVLAGLALIGVPLTTGFVSKWYLVQALLSDGLWPVAVFVLVASVLAVAYIWRVVEVAWFHEPSGRAAEATEAPLSLLLPLWFLVLTNLWFGVNTKLTVGVAELAARALVRLAG